MNTTFEMLVRTPHDVVFERGLTSARVPTETGQVGLRPHSEPTILVVEAGLLLFKDHSTTLFAASAGGLLQVNPKGAILYTPFAVVGASAQAVLGLLDAVAADPKSELQAHRQVENLERRILQEVRDRNAQATSLGRTRA